MLEIENERLKTNSTKNRGMLLQIHINSKGKGPKK